MLYWIYIWYNTDANVVNVYIYVYTYNGKNKLSLKSFIFSWPYVILHVASQMWCLYRLLPLIIHEWILEGNCDWELFCDLIKIVDIVFVPIITKGQQPTSALLETLKFSFGLIWSFFHFTVNFTITSQFSLFQHSPWTTTSMFLKHSPWTTTSMFTQRLAFLRSTSALTIINYPSLQHSPPI